VDWNAGLLDWNSGLECWNAGLLDWNSGLEYWNAGLPDWATGLTQTAKNTSFSAVQKLNVLIHSVMYFANIAP